MTDPDDGTSWGETSLEHTEHNVTIRFLKKMPNVQILYMRLPDGASDGQGYAAHGGQSLRKLYKGELKSITATDQSATYTLESLKDLIRTLLKQRAARHISVLDYGTPIPGDNDFDGDHSDHAISARLVAEVVKQEKINGTFRG